MILKVRVLAILLVGLTAFSIGGCGDKVRLKTTPQHQAAADALGSGKFSKVDDETFLFAMGAAQDIVDKCKPKVEQQTLADLAPFFEAALWQGAQGNKYRFGDDLSDLSEAMADQASSQAAFFGGIVAARQLECAEPAGTQIVQHAHDLSIQMKGGADGMKSNFVSSCARFHGAETCSCVALAGLASDTNVFEKTYSKELVYEMMQRSQLNAMKIVLGCQLTRY